MGDEARVHPWRSWAVVAATVLGLIGCAAWGIAVAYREHFGALSVVLLVAAAASGFGAAKVHGRETTISAGFMVFMLGATFLGPASACVLAAVSELTTHRDPPTRRRARVINVLGLAVPALLVGTIIRDAAPADHRAIGFSLVLAGLTLGALVLNWLIIAPLFIAMDGEPEEWSLRAWRRMLPTIAINIALVVSGAAIYVRVGIGGIIFALAGVFAFSYHAYLVAAAQQRAEEHAALSWGVLAGLMRSMDIRDDRAARHAAAVAKFSRDIATAVGMTPKEAELAHTAGLLHDIGHFALSDRVAERGRTLTEEDWVAIQRHPELGADMLRDLGLYGPVAQIVLAHHERIDGRGYPNGLREEEIPEIAKIIAVAEVYDTLTASDTYRTRMSSFEALRELRRVAGTQLDPRYVESLANLLAGVGVDYRHADSADFDTELDMERRIREAGAGG